MKTLTAFAYEEFSAKTLRINKSSLTLTMKTLISFAYEVARFTRYEVVRFAHL